MNLDTKFKKGLALTLADIENMEKQESLTPAQMNGVIMKEELYKHIVRRLEKLRSKPVK